VPIEFYGDFCANGAYSVVLTDDSDSSNSQTASGSSSGCAYGMTNVKTLKIKPSQSMTLKIPSAKYSSYHVSLSVEGCYKVLINGKEQNTIDGSGVGSGDNGACDSTQAEKQYTVVVVPKSDNGGSGTCGDGSGDQGSVHWEFSMGGLSSGQSAGSLLISEGVIDTASYTPNALLYYAPSSEVEVIRNAGILRQVKAPEGLADIVTINASKYEIRYYLASNAGSKVSGVYVPQGSPYVTWIVERPSGAPAGQMRITESRGAISLANDFTYDSATNAWSYNRGGKRLKTSTTANLANGDQQVTKVISDPSTGVVALKTIETKHTFPWGKEVIQRIEDPNGSPITTDYTFYEDISDGGGYGKLKWFTRSDGYWEKYEYNSSGSNYGTLNVTYRP